MKYDLKINKVDKSRIQNVDFETIIFGKEFSDHIFISEFDGTNWVNTRIEPYGNLSLSPALSCMHYGQSIFEGMKVFRAQDNHNYLFRPELNYQRLKYSAERMCMQVVPEDLFFLGLNTLCAIDADWVPSFEDSSLYLRPFLIASDDFLGIRPSTRYIFMIYGCSVGKYYTQPLRIKVETKFVRACEGGVGNAKTAGNYAASLLASNMAQKEGFHQVLWTDAKQHEYCEELGTSNFFIFDGETVFTPELSGTVLNGVTRNSVIQLIQHFNIPVIECRLSIKDIFEWSKTKKLEAFATGTAATITEIQELNYNNNALILSIDEHNLAKKIKTKFDGIRYGKEKDIFNWMKKVAQLNLV